MKKFGFLLLACGIVALSGCASDADFNSAEAAKTQDKVAGEANPDAPDASQQQQTPTKPGFRF